MSRAIMYRLVDQRGASAVEFAIVLPLLVLFVFGIIEFGIIFYDKAMVTNASREGARKGIVYRSQRVALGEIQSVVNNYCSGKMITFGSPSTPDCTVQLLSPECLNHNDQLIVEVSYQYDFLLIPNFLGGVLPPNITIKAVTEMRCE